MNIGIFSDTYLPEVNGIVTSVVNFKQELERAGHNVYIFAPGYELISRASKRRREKNVFRFSSFQYPLYKSWRVAIPLNRGAQHTISKLKLDVVHSQHPFSMGLFATGIAWRNKIPHVHTYHTMYPEYAKIYFPGFKKWNQKAAEKLSMLFCNRADHIIAPSDGIKTKLKSYGVTIPITVVPTGIERAFFETKDATGSIRRKYKIPVRAPLAITVARLGKEKSIDYCLHAFKQVLRHNPDAYYLIVGDGPAKLDLQTLARELGIIERVAFTGFVHDRADVMRAYSTANVFMYASKTETQCLTLLEAAAASVPLVARYDKPLETALHHEVNGFFVKEDVNKFAWKVNKLLADHKMAKKFGQESLKIAKAGSAEHQTKELLKVYKQTVTDRISGKLTPQEQGFLEDNLR